jgi:transposase
LGLVKKIKKQIDKFELKPEELGFSNNLIINTKI